MIIFLTLLFLLWASMIQADTHNAASCSKSDVEAAISAAIEGDTVTVPVCAETTWTSQLTINKAITLQGAGIDQTRIRGTFGTGYIIYYNPTSSTHNVLFSITGFTFNSNYTTSILGLDNYSISNKARIRIHHNKFTNLVRFSSGQTASIDIDPGTVTGVFDNNYLQGNPLIHMLGDNLSNWNNEVLFFGTSENFYFEDNTFYCDGPAQACTIASAWGARYVARYNTFTLNNPTYSADPWFDMHGNQDNNLYGVMGGEVYGNKLTHLQNLDAKIMHHRGGKLLLFYNKVISSGTNPNIHAMEEFVDSVNPTNWANGTAGPCPGGSPVSCTDYEPQHVNDSYYWNNRAGSSGQNLVSPWYQNGDYNNQNNPSWSAYDNIGPNKNYRYQVGGFDGTSHMGCGTLTSRPSNCTTGVGYWATDQGCSSIADANIGANPTTPLAGTLYKCTATNTWTAYYTPYTYPHPLRESIDLTPPYRSGQSPSGYLQCDSNPKSFVLALNTDEAATCKYSLTDQSYDLMENIYNVTGETSHSQIITLPCNPSYTYYSRCTDGTGNKNTDSVITTWSLSREGGADIDVIIR